MSPHRFTSRSGVNIHYLDNEPADPQGLPIVFSPGIVDAADDYLPMLDFVAPRRLVVVDPRGRGRSESPSTGYSLAELATDLEAVIDECGFDRFHLMTFSRGTPTALTLAFDRPDAIASISVGDYLLQEVGLPPEFVDRQMSLTWRGKPMPERVERHVIEGIQQTSRSRMLWDDVAALKVPVLFVRGTEQGAMGANDEVVDRYREAIPDVEVVSLEGVGHDLFRPERLAYPAAVVEFVSRLG
ncbi:MAG TPA: alpha/beta hydrolase [Acidimicrobiales bacterium]